MRGRKPAPDEEAEDFGTDALSDKEYTELLAALKKRAKEGDPHASRQLLEQHTANRSAKAMDFQLNITPYDIEDRSLSMIVQQADLPVVMEILSGLAIRLEADEFSRDIKRTLISFRQMFEDESERIYAAGKEE